MYTVELKNFDIAQICNSGQCFRMEEKEGGIYSVIAGGRYLEVQQKEGKSIFLCEQAEFEQFWNHYFDLSKDYSIWIRSIDPEDRYLKKAAQFGNGIRILNQDVWEMIISFIISQQNNIKRIRKCIQALCETYGEERKNFRGESYFDFPTQKALVNVSEEEYRQLGLGYRSKYLVKTVQSIWNREVDLDEVKKLPFRKAKKELLKLTGIGEKVAECVCLFGLHQLEGFPKDTHILQICERHYKDGFPFQRYEGCVGLMQQYLFYYDLCGNK